MDNLVLTRLAFDLAADLPGARVEAFRQESSDRFRLGFAGPDRVTSLVVSIHPERPWVGGAAVRWEGPRWSPDPIAVAVSRRLVGLRVEAVVKPHHDRRLLLRCAGGSAVALVLSPHAANLVLLTEGDAVEASARPSARRSSHALAGRFDPFTHDAAEIDAFLACADDPRRALAGIGGGVFDAVARDAAARSITIGTALKALLDVVVSGATDIVILGPDAPRAALARNELAPPDFRILAWRPSEARDAYAEGSAAATVGLFYEGVDAAARLRARLHALRGLLRSEVSRIDRAERRVQAECTAFEDPDRYQRLGEALLAGLTRARRDDDAVWVPDPYGASAELAVPAPRGMPLPEAARALFKRARRARRGRETTAERASVLAVRRRRLDKILGSAERAANAAGADAVEAAMRDAGIAVGLPRATRAGRAADRLEAPRVSGVRTVTSAAGWTILIGRSGKDNDRLTFKLAAPEDIWLHAADVAGAHVVIRNPDRVSEVPDATLREAAGAAAWFSDARSQGFVDVHWARRKHVRRARGGTPGRVTLKHFQTLRVRAKSPAGLD